MTICKNPKKRPSITVWLEMLCTELVDHSVIPYDIIILKYYNMIYYHMKRCNMVLLINNKYYKLSSIA